MLTMFIKFAASPQCFIQSRNGKLPDRSGEVGAVSTSSLENCRDPQDEHDAIRLGFIPFG